MKKILTLLLAAASLTACDIDRLPYNSMAAEQITNDPSASLESLMNGMYAQLKTWSDPMHRCGEYAGDNMMIRGSSTDAFYEFISFSRTPVNYRLQNFWDYGPGNGSSITNEKREYMKSRIISLVIFAVCMMPHWAKAQITASNPLEWMALAEGNEVINDQIEKQINGQTKTAMLQNSIAAEFNRIHKWEKQYNSYLKTASGYASSLKACTHLYNDGVRIFLTLGKLGKAIRNNPQGIVASMSMNNLYIETATELVSVFTLLNDAVAKGGHENMLTGAERSKTLWALNDKLSAFSRKLHLLYLSIRYYTLNDVWNNVTAGMLDRNNGEAARMAMTRWRRAAVLAR